MITQNCDDVPVLNLMHRPDPIVQPCGAMPRRPTCPDIGNGSSFNTTPAAK